MGASEPFGERMDWLSGQRVFQAEGTASAEARVEIVDDTQGTAGGPVQQGWKVEGGWQGRKRGRVTEP